MSLFDADHAEQPPEVVVFFTCGLISKWGFNDGDLLEWLNYFEEFPWDFDEHEVLCHIVKTRLVPQLNATIKLSEIESHHNPIRASLINGVAPNWYEQDARFEWLLPASIELSGAEVLEIARSIRDGKVANSN